MKTRQSLLALTGVILLSGLCWRGRIAMQPPAAKAATPPPLPQIIFDQLKMKGSVLNAHVTILEARNVHSMTQVTVQTLAIGKDRAISPFPQYNISDSNSSTCNAQSNRMSDENEPLPLRKTGIGMVNANLDDRRYAIDKSNTRFVRLKVIAMQGPDNPKNWTNPVSVVRFSKWMPYKSTAKR